MSIEDPLVTDARDVTTPGVPPAGRDLPAGRASRLRATASYLSRRPGLTLAIVWIVLVVLAAFHPSLIAPDSPLLPREDVILAPHALGWTESFARSGSRSVIDAVLAVARGERPEHVVNPEALPAALREGQVDADSVR